MQVKFRKEPLSESAIKKRLCKLIKLVFRATNMDFYQGQGLKANYNIICR